jgi:cell shape-determining protein MreD
VGALYVRRTIVPATILTLLIVAIQLEVLSTLRFAGVVIMLVWLWPVAVGLAGFTGLAMWVAFVGGVFFDTHTTTPFGLTAIVAMLFAYGASLLGREGVGDLDSAAIWVTPSLAALAGFFAPLVYTFGGVFVFNFELWRGSLGAMMVVNAVAFFLLARPVTRLARAVGHVGERVRR